MTLGEERGGGSPLLSSMFIFILTVVVYISSTGSVSLLPFTHFTLLASRLCSVNAAVVVVSDNQLL